MIWLLRHAEAEDGSPDAERKLTKKGRKQARNAGLALEAIGVELDACFTSPKVRSGHSLARKTYGKRNDCHRCPNEECE